MRSSISSSLVKKGTRARVDFVADLERFFSRYSAIPVQSRVCFVKFKEASCVDIAQHLTNTVFIDRHLIVIPVPEESIASADQLGDPSLEGSLIPLPHAAPQITAEQLLSFFSSCGEVKFIRLLDIEEQETRCAYLEFTEAPSVLIALQYNGVIFGGKTLKVQYSKHAIVKPPSKYDKDSDRNSRRGQALTDDAQGPVLGQDHVLIEGDLALDPGTSHMTEVKSDAEFDEEDDDRPRKSKDKDRERERSREKTRDKERERDHDRDRDRDRARDPKDRERDRDRDRNRDKRDKDRDRDRDRDRERDRERDRDRSRIKQSRSPSESPKRSRHHKKKKDKKSKDRRRRSDYEDSDGDKDTLHKMMFMGYDLSEKTLVPEGKVPWSEAKREDCQDGYCDLLTTVANLVIKIDGRGFKSFKRVTKILHRPRRHDLFCAECQSIKNVLKDIEETIEKQELTLTDEQIFSSRDAIRKAKEAYLITRANTLEPNGLNKRDETY
ncbi:hypothetical protein QZH41_001954 [Actinostola sp. cb2023]|nr:hypothetical protein QZH41_001954 [Actinostola sp. cb2023]